MNILFVVREIEYIDHMGYMLLSALAKEQGHRTDISVLADEDIDDALRRVRPDLVAFSAKTGEHRWYLQANDRIKSVSKEIVTVMGGPHTTYFPEVVDQHELDAVCVGEGDDAWVELLDAFEAGRDVSEIPNIQTREGRASGQVPQMRDRVRILDDLPFLDRALMYENTRIGRFPLRSAMAGRGCPYTCTYCFNHVYNLMYRGKGKLYNRHSVDRLCAELAELKAGWETQFIKFYDDVFVFSDDEWLDEFAEEYPKRVGVPFHALTRADLLTEEILLKLKRAGLGSLTMSIEAGNDYVRENILKRGMTREQIYNAFHLCEKHGIPTFANTILGIPGTGLKEDIESLDLNLECKVSFGEFPIFFPYPKTDLANYAIARGEFHGDFDTLHMSYQSESPLTGFDEKLKLQQKNLSLLGQVVLWQPWLRNVTVNYLINWRLTPLYFWAYYFAKAYVIKRKIYPMRLDLKNLLRTVVGSFRLENFKHNPSSADDPGSPVPPGPMRPNKMDRPIGDGTLGGPWS